MLLIILLSLTANAQTPYRNEDGKKIDKEELETKDYLPEIHGTIRTKFEYQTEMAASRFEVRNARISITGNVLPIVAAGCLRPPFPNKRPDRHRRTNASTIYNRRPPLSTSAIFR